MLPLLLAAVLALLTVAAPPPAKGAPEPAPRRTIALPAPTIEVESLGQEPRRSLRSPGRPGARDTLELTAEGLVNVFVDAVRTVNERPIPMHLTIELVVIGEQPDAAAAKGDASTSAPSIRATIQETDVTLSPSHDVGVVASTREQLERLRGKTFTLHRRGDGSLRSIEFDAELAPEVPGATDLLPFGSVLDRVVLALVEAFPPLPSEPLGVDAAWSSTVDQRRTEIDRMTVTDYLLRSLDEREATIAVSREVDVREPFQPLSDGRIAGATLSRVARMTGRGSGMLSLDPTRLAPLTLNMQTLLSLFIEGRTIPDGGRTIVHEQEFLGARIPHGTIGSRSAGPAPGLSPGSSGSAPAYSGDESSRKARPSGGSSVDPK